MQKNRNQTDTKKSTPDITLRGVIVEAFQKSGLTEKDLSKALSVHPRTAHRILTDDGLFIASPMLRRVADVLALDYDVLTAIRPPFPKPPKIVSTADGGFDDDEEERMAEFIGRHHDNG